MKKIIGVFLSVVILSACSDAQVDKQNDKMEQSDVINKVVSASEFKAMMEKENVQLVDVRTPEEYSAGKIDEARNINFYDDDFQQQMAKLDKDKPVLVYCRSGARSGKAMNMLGDMGFSEVYNLQGGYMGWPDK